MGGRGRATEPGFRPALERGLLLAAVLASSVAVLPGSASAFGTIEGGGQHREHERITRAAVACPAGASSDDDCFEPRSVDQLAGRGKGFGAVGSPDLTEVSNPAAHCDDADFLAGDYPQTRDQATAALLGCIDHLRRRFSEAVDAAEGLLDDDGEVVDAQVGLATDCELGGGEPRAKCQTLEAFGRALHGAQDFYSHSNWADATDPSRPTGADNPPGLNRLAPSPILDLRGNRTPTVPLDLTTGCFVIRDRVPGEGVCEGRITHAALNKDNGLVDPVAGAATSPTTPRGAVGSNFSNAVAGAIVETRRQWQDLRAALRNEYGEDKASVIACALTHDDPAKDCRHRSRSALALAGLGALAGFLCVGYLWYRARGRLTRAG